MCVDVRKKKKQKFLQKEKKRSFLFRILPNQATSLLPSLKFPFHFFNTMILLTTTTEEKNVLKTKQKKLLEFLKFVCFSGPFQLFASSFFFRKKLSETQKKAKLKSSRRTEV